MAYDPVADRAERVARLRAQRDNTRANLRGWERQVRTSGRLASELLAEAIRDAMVELDRLDRELEREGG